MKRILLSILLSLALCESGLSQANFIPKTLPQLLDVSDSVTFTAGKVLYGNGSAWITLQTGTGVGTALAINVGSAGAFVVNNGDGGGITLDASGFNGNLATTDNTLQEIAQKLDDLSTGGATNWTDIADASGNTSIALAGFTTLFTSTLDNGIAWEISDTDADAANATTLLKLSHNDGADADVTYLSMIGDKDGTPVNDYIFNQAGATFLKALDVQATLSADGFSADTVSATTITAIDTLVASGNFLPDSNDSAIIGAAGNAFSDLFLAEGAVINWDSSDVTITQTGNILAVAGGDLRVATADVGTNADSVPTISSTNTFTNKTLDGSGTGNVVKLKGYIYLTHPHLADGTGATISTTATSIAYGHATFSNSADKAANYVEYYLQVPEDLDTSVALRGRLKVLLGNTDTADQNWLISSVSVADSAVPTSATLANEIALDYTADASGANGDVETTTWTTLTSWAGALTAGQTWRIRLMRDGDTSDASTVNSTELGLVIEYGISQ